MLRRLVWLITKVSQVLVFMGMTVAFVLVSSVDYPEQLHEVVRDRFGMRDRASGDVHSDGLDSFKNERRWNI